MNECRRRSPLGFRSTVADALGKSAPTHVARSGEAAAREVPAGALTGDGALETQALLAHLRSVGLSDPAHELGTGSTRLMPPGSTREELEEQYRLQLERHELRRSQGAERDLLARALLTGGDDVSRRFESLNSLLNARGSDTAERE